MTLPACDHDVVALHRRAKTIVTKHGHLRFGVPSPDGGTRQYLIWRGGNVQITLSEDGLEVRWLGFGPSGRIHNSYCVFMRYAATSPMAKSPEDIYVDHTLVKLTLRNIAQHMVLDDLANA